jgi:hypothetical protein
VSAIAVEGEDADNQHSARHCTFKGEDVGQCPSASANASAHTDALTELPSLCEQDMHARLVWWLRHLGMPDRAVNAWIGSAAMPGVFTPFCFAMVFAAMIVDAVLYFVGTSGHTGLLKTLTRCASGATVAMGVYMVAALWLVGPSTDPQPGTFAVSIMTFTVLCHACKEVSSAVAAIDNVPFANRFVFLLLSGALHWSIEAASCAGLNAAERALRSTHLGPVIWAASIRTIRALDVLSDIMYTRLLYDVVRSREL